MSFHHLAIATRDMKATHEFYANAMGFELVRAEKAQMQDGGWAKHFFYDTGDGEMMAFWELHIDEIPDDFPTSISVGLGLPEWTNHIAFGASSLDDLATRRQRLLDAGHGVTEIDHHWCKSIYAMDPNGILIEFCVTTRSFTKQDRDYALVALDSRDMKDEPAPIVNRYEPEQAAEVAQTAPL
ncbi:MAG: VOC family protein [Gammaproteobacteria bacterium]|nr:MAG: VOC family protein [Gammaproteobacteria bacterium]